MDDHYNTMRIIIIRGPCSLALPYVDSEDWFAVSPETMMNRGMKRLEVSIMGLARTAMSKYGGASEVDVASLRKILTKESPPLINQTLMMSFANSRPCICQPENFKLSMWWHGLSQHLDGKKNHQPWCFCHKRILNTLMPSNFEFASLLSRGDTGSWRDGVPSFQSLVHAKNAPKFWASRCEIGKKLRASGVASANAHMAAMWAFSANLAIWSCSACRVMANLTSPQCHLWHSYTQETPGSNEALFCNCRHVTVPDPPSSWWVPCKFEKEKPANSSVATQKARPSIDGRQIGWCLRALVLRTEPHSYHQIMHSWTGIPNNLSMTLVLPCFDRKSSCFWLFLKVLVEPPRIEDVYLFIDI